VKFVHFSCKLPALEVSEEQIRSPRVEARFSPCPQSVLGMTDCHEQSEMEVRSRLAPASP